MRVEDHACDSLGLTGTTGHADEGVTSAERVVGRRVAPLPGVGPIGTPDEHERRHEFLQPLVFCATLAHDGGECMRIAEQRGHLDPSDEAEVLDLVERTARDHASSELAHRHAHLVDAPDVVGLGALAAGQPRRRACDGGSQLTVRGGIVLHHGEQLGGGCFTLAGAFGVVQCGIGMVGRQPHPFDRSHGERGAGLPCGRPALPLVGAAAAEVEHELIERLGELGRVGLHAGQGPHRMAGRSRVDLTDAGDDRHDQIRSAHCRGNGGDGADGHRGHVRGEEMVREVGAVKRDQRQVALPQLGIGEGGVVGPIRPERDGLVAVIGELGEVVQRGLTEDPCERRSDLLAQVRTNVTRHLLVRRDARLGTEERVVHGLP